MNETSLRLAAFDWLASQEKYYDGVLPRKVLESGFEFHGNKLTLLGPRGIWKPKQFKVPLSITTVINSPYNDQTTDDEFILYAFMGSDPYHVDNRGLRTAMKYEIPLIYFSQIIKGEYQAFWPAQIVGEDIDRLSFKVLILPPLSNYKPNTALPFEVGDGSSQAKKYATYSTKHRLHQKAFHRRVMHAYNTQCAVCQLKHKELLDAAHIISDKEDHGDPIVQNGISLCKIHHAAYEHDLVGIRPDYCIEVRQDVLEEQDGPMLKYGLQSVHKSNLILPKQHINRPDPDRLAIKYSNFKNNF